MNHDKEIAKLMDDIKGIIKVLDPEGFKWAEEEKRKRELRIYAKKKTAAKFT